MLEPKTETLTKQRVLLIEDDPGDARFLAELLSESARPSFHVEHAEKLAAALERLKRGGIDLILLDLSLPDSHGYQTFARVHAIAHHLPIIILSGLDDQDLAVRTVHEGAQDYLVKGQVDSRLLLRSMRYAIKRKRAESALSQERDLLHTLLNNSPDRIYFKDENSRFLRINPALAAHFKLTHPQQAIGRTDFDFFTLEHAQAAFDDEQRIMQTGKPIIGLVEKETHPDGRLTWAFTSKMPLRDKHGKIIGTFGISRDITELKKYENALAAERNLLRSLIDNLPDYIYVKDDQSRYLLDNIAHRRFLGVSTSAEIVGKTTADFFPTELSAEFMADDQAIIESGKPLVNREQAILDRAGNKRWHATTKVPLRDTDEKIIGLVGISRDITEHKEAEEQLRKANSELVRSREELLKVLTDLKKSHEELKATQFQLIQAAKLESVGTLAAGVAHEVKNPLQTILVGIDFFNNHLAQRDDNIELVLVDMRDAVRRADAIVRDLLEFSASNHPVVNEENLNKLLEKTLGLVNYELTKARIRLLKELNPNLPAIRLDKNKIEQVFINLFMNAIQAMPRGGTLTVRTGLKIWTAVRPGDTPLNQFKAGEKLAQIEVDDSGTGIPPEHLDKIFDPFFTTKPTGSGTGLGLPITKKIVEMHGGIIDLKNRPEGGVRATVLLSTEA